MNKIMNFINIFFKGMWEFFGSTACLYLIIALYAAHTFAREKTTVDLVIAFGFFVFFAVDVLFMFKSTKEKKTTDTSESE